MHRRRGQGFGLFLLAAELFRVGINTVPPVTLISILLMVVCYIQPNTISRLNRISWPNLGDVCVSVGYTLHQQQWKRILISALFHGDDMHLYFNMLSFLWKGKQLETKFGSNVYLLLLIALTVTTNLLYIVINILLSEFVDYSYTYHCAVGFSGVVFALKVILADFTPNTMSSVMGIFSVPMRYASWLELVLISILVPNASFVGHLSGILVGLFTVWFYKTCLGRRNYFYGRPERVGSIADSRREQEMRQARIETENAKKRLEKRENEMIEEAKKRSLEEVKNLIPKQDRRESQEIRRVKPITDSEKELNVVIAEREAMRIARLARFQK